MNNESEMKTYSNTLTNELLLMSLTKFYHSDTEKINLILPIIKKTSKISLRLIDWFVTNYCKKFNIVLTNSSQSDSSKYFNVYSSYRSQLKAFKKIQFDPFRRRIRIDFYYDVDKCVETTIGQLNFFRWFLENDLLSYICEYYDVIEKDMISIQAKDSIIPRDFEHKKKRLELSKSLIKNMTTYNGNTMVSF